MLGLGSGGGIGLRLNVGLDSGGGAEGCNGVSSVELLTLPPSRDHSYGMVSVLGLMSQSSTVMVFLTGNTEVCLYS